MLTEIKKCPRCKKEKAIDNFFFNSNERRYQSWCKKCMNESQVARIRDRKAEAVKLMGDKCSLCGYDRNYSALTFHHIDPNTKEFNWDKLQYKSWKEIINELSKCALVCTNCHREIHNPQHNRENITNTANKLLKAEIIATGKCPICGDSVYKTTYCSEDCVNKAQRRVKRPSKEALEQLLTHSNFKAISEAYGVTDNTVRKWAKSYGLPVYLEDRKILKDQKSKESSYATFIYEI